MSRIILSIAVCFVLGVPIGADFRKQGSIFSIWHPCQFYHIYIAGDPKPCKYGESDCIVKLVNELISSKASQGDRALNLVKLDPLPVAKMNIKQGADSPVNIDLTFTDNNVYGISTMKIRKVK